MVGLGRKRVKCFDSLSANDRIEANTVRVNGGRVYTTHRLSGWAGTHGADAAGGCVRVETLATAFKLSPAPRGWAITCQPFPTGLLSVGISNP